LATNPIEINAQLAKQYGFEYLEKHENNDIALLGSQRIRDKK